MTRANMLRLTELQQQVFGAAGMNAIAWGARFLVTLVTIPALLAYLGKEGFGLWMLALSILTLLNMLANGIGSSLITLSAQSKDHETLQGVVTAAFMLAAGVGIVILGLGYVAAASVSWTTLFNVSTISEAEMADLVATLAVCLCVANLASIGRSVLIGKLKGARAYMIDMIASIVSAIVLILLVWNEAPLAVLVSGFFLSRQLIVLANGMVYLSRSGVVFWRPRSIRPGSFQHVLGRGILLSFNTVTQSLATHSDLLLISLLASVASAGDYAIVQRLFGIFILVVGFVNTALWPAFTQAHAKGRYLWIRRIFVKTFAIVTTLSVMFGFAGSMVTPDLIDLWLNVQTELSPLLVWGMGASVVTFAIAGTIGNLLRALDRLKLLTALRLVMLLVNLALTVSLIPLIGAAGAIWGTVIAYFVCLIVPYAFIIPRTLAELVRQQEKNLRPSAPTVRRDLINR